MVSPLANPNLPLGTAEAMAAAAADPAGETGWNPPVSDRNAYANQANGITSGTNAGPSTEVSNAGLYYWIKLRLPRKKKKGTF